MNAVTSPFTNRFTDPAFQRRIASIASTGVALIGMAVLAGWFLGLPAITAFLSQGVTMKANTALCFLFLGLALWLSQRSQAWTKTTAQLLAISVSLIALATMIQYLTGLNFGIDELLVRNPRSLETRIPGRMSPATSINMILLGVAVTLLHRGRDTAVQIIAAMVSIIALLAVVGYLYNVDSLRRVGPFTTIALHTALTFLLAVTALLFTRSGRSVMGIVCSATSGGMMARNLLPAAIVIPIIIGSVRLYGQRIELYDTEFGLAIMVLGTITFLCALILWNAAALRRMEERQAQLEDQFRQSQKMEAVGQLAGGVAHDFNNLLTVIMGYSNLIRESLTSNDRNYGNADEILKASTRAASLTRQLLVFSRRQAVRHTAVDLSALVLELHTFLGRVIGEHIELSIRLAPDLWLVKGDRNQMDQILSNLAVNARDAMPEGGRLIIETENVVLDESFANRHLGTQLGPHVMLAVSDTGIGMDKETQTHIFEPFFTTKEAGKGTGLGLATVYGIVKQANGSIWLYSEPGKGTTFRLYFPRDKSAAPVAESLTAPLPRASVPLTIFVVEDDDMVRKLACDVLRMQGHIIFEARDPAQALAMSPGGQGRIDLLISDMIMPGGTGRSLFEQLSTRRPDMRVLFMSGHTDKVIAYYDTFDSAVPFLQKPFTPDDLLRKVSDLFPGGSA